MYGLYWFCGLSSAQYRNLNAQSFLASQLLRSQKPFIESIHDSLNAPPARRAGLD